MPTLYDNLSSLLLQTPHDKAFIVTDRNVAPIERLLIDKLNLPLCIIPSGESHKNLPTLASVLEFLASNGATRHSILICIGGGVVTDLGGFAAAVFKRGIRHINVSTTLLGSVDAAVGGKTGIDFLGLKNEIGAFHHPIALFTDTLSFQSLPTSEILSGFGEVVKTAYLCDPQTLQKVLLINPAHPTADDFQYLCTLCQDKKREIVTQDPTEKGIRKALNLGHTAGHAFESLLIAKNSPVPHGTAVAHGLLVSLILSMDLRGFDKKLVSQYAAWLRAHYTSLPITCQDYAQIWQTALHDKKNTADGTLRFTLLSAPGAIVTDCPVSQPQLFAALDLYQELLGH